MKKEANESDKNKDIKNSEEETNSEKMKIFNIISDSKFLDKKNNLKIELIKFFKF